MEHRLTIVIHNFVVCLLVELFLLLDDDPIEPDFATVNRYHHNSAHVACSISDVHARHRSLYEDLLRIIRYPLTE